MSGGRVLASGGKTAVEKTRGLRGRLARVVDTLPDAAPRVRVDAAPADVAEALTRVEDWLERERPAVRARARAGVAAGVRGGGLALAGGGGGSVPDLAVGAHRGQDDHGDERAKREGVLARQQGGLEAQLRVGAFEGGYQG